jgi:hypothetical protein
MANIPPILKHMTLAIFRSGDIRGGTMERFKKSFDAAVNRLTTYGYIVGADDNFKETGKSNKHHKEGMRGFVKDRTFDGLFLVMKAGKRGVPAGGSDRTTDLRGHTLSKPQRHETEGKRVEPSRVPDASSTGGSAPYWVGASKKGR